MHEYVEVTLGTLATCTRRPRRIARVRSSCSSGQLELKLLGSDQHRVWLTSELIASGLHTLRGQLINDMHHCQGAGLWERVFGSSQRVGLVAQGLQRSLDSQGRVGALKQPSDVLVAAVQPHVSVFLSDVETVCMGRGRTWASTYVGIPLMLRISQQRTRYMSHATPLHHGIA